MCLCLSFTSNPKDEVYSMNEFLDGTSRIGFTSLIMTKFKLFSYLKSERRGVMSNEVANHYRQGKYLGTGEGAERRTNGSGPHAKDATNKTKIV